MKTTLFTLSALLISFTLSAQDYAPEEEKERHFVVSAAGGGSIPLGSYAGQNSNTDGHATLGYNAMLSFLYVGNMNVGIGATVGVFDNNAANGNSYYLLTPAYTVKHKKLKADFRTMFGLVSVGTLDQQGYLNSTLYTTYHTTKRSTTTVGVGAGIDFRAEIIPALDMFCGLDFIYTSVHQNTSITNSSMSFGGPIDVPVSILNVNWGLSYDW